MANALLHKVRFKIDPTRQHFTDSKVRLLGTVNPVTRTEPLMYILKFRISNKSYGVTVKRLWHCVSFIILRIEFAFLNFDTLYFLGTLY